MKLLPGHVGVGCVRLVLVSSRTDNNRHDTDSTRLFRKIAYFYVRPFSAKATDVTYCRRSSAPDAVHPQCVEYDRLPRWMRWRTTPHGIGDENMPYSQRPMLTQRPKRQ